jgi:hypothetical protein
MDVVDTGIGLDSVPSCDISGFQLYLPKETQGLWTLC